MYNYLEVCSQGTLFSQRHISAARLSQPLDVQSAQAARQPLLRTLRATVSVRESLRNNLTGEQQSVCLEDTREVFRAYKSAGRTKHVIAAGYHSTRW